MYFCIVKGCSSNTKINPELSFHCLPEARSRFSTEFQKLLEKRRKAWLLALGLNEKSLLNVKHVRVCSLHFKSGQFNIIL